MKQYIKVAGVMVGLAGLSGVSGCINDVGCLPGDAPPQLTLSIYDADSGLPIACDITGSLTREGDNEVYPMTYENDQVTCVDDTTVMVSTSWGDADFTLNIAKPGYINYEETGLHLAMTTACAGEPGNMETFDKDVFLTQDL